MSQFAVSAVTEATQAYFSNAAQLISGGALHQANLQMLRALSQFGPVRFWQTYDCDPGHGRCLRGSSISEFLKAEDVKALVACIRTLKK